MGKSPEPPGGGAPQPKPAHFDNGGESSDGGEIAIVLVLEGAGRRVPLDSGVDDVGGMASLLLCRGCQPGYSSARPAVRGRRVPDREGAGATVHGEIAVDGDAAGLVTSQPEPLRGRRRSHPGGPECR